MVGSDARLLETLLDFKVPSRCKRPFLEIGGLEIKIKSGRFSHLVFKIGNNYYLSSRKRTYDNVKTSFFTRQVRLQGLWHVVRSQDHRHFTKSRQR